MIFGIGLGGRKNHFFEKLKNYKDFNPISEPPRVCRAARRFCGAKILGNYDKGWRVTAEKSAPALIFEWWQGLKVNHRPFRNWLILPVSAPQD